MPKSAKEIWNEIIRFWEEEPRNFKRIPNVSLVPESDPTLLFVNSGMFPLVPYLSGEKHPLGKRLFNTQRAIRTGVEDLEEIGDSFHTTCFSMFGDWSLGDFFKKEQIPWITELYIERFGWDINKFYVSVFKGDSDAPKDKESIDLWKNEFAARGVEALVTDNPQDIKKNFDENGNLKEGPTYRIFLYGKDECWWQRGEAPGELGGPCSEMFFDCGKNVKGTKYEKNLHINDNSGRFVEVGNNVFMEYYLDDNMNWQKLPQKNVDFGGGIERVVFCLAGKQDIFDTELFSPVINLIEKETNESYQKLTEEKKAPYRIIADHIRAATFIIGDGVVPSNKAQGYILRSFIRRTINQANKLGLKKGFCAKLSDITIDILKQFDDYEFLETKKERIKSVLLKEESKFEKTLKSGLKVLDKELKRVENFDGENAFFIYETHGLPLDLILDELKERSYKLNTKKFVNQFENARKAHKEKSRAGAEQIFKGGLADSTKETTAYHTATHMLMVSLNIVLKPEIEIVQKGSNITADRLRFDFNYNRALTDEEIKEIENLVNTKIQEHLKVEWEEMKKSQADKLGVKGQFEDKYGDIVKVYKIWNPDTSEIFSIEFCGGPHVENTRELEEMGEFKIIKQESIGAGIRRIKAVLQK